MSSLKITYQKPDNGDVSVLVVSSGESFGVFGSGLTIHRVFTSAKADCIWDCLNGKPNTFDTYEEALTILAKQLSDATGCDYILARNEALSEAKVKNYGK